MRHGSCQTVIMFLKINHRVTIDGLKYLMFVSSFILYVGKLVYMFQPHLCTTAIRVQVRNIIFCPGFTVMKAEVCIISPNVITYGRMGSKERTRPVTSGV